MMNQVNSCDKEAYQQHVDGTTARDSCPYCEKWMVELVRAIPWHTLQNVIQSLIIRYVTILIAGFFEDKYQCTMGRLTDI